MPETPEVTQELAHVFEVRQRQRSKAVNRALATLRPYERRLVHEAAGMGYVRGTMRGRIRAGLGEPRDGDIPPDRDILFEVIASCVGMDNLYPYLAAASQGRRRRVTRARMWPGEKEEVSGA